ncbi:DoxX family protein [Ferruginibacter sp. SUN106]|uniref:DoxX family protein n=1 Tax=Ferruginibacter sp. SUN106 TaxID=2978348 RepID=UPI003D3662C8
MKKNTIIYWVATGIFSFMMLFSAYSYITKPEMAAAFKHLGFPDYFRIELAIAKISGALVLIIPQIPVKIKEWAYAGFGITFISATIAHFVSGDPANYVSMPIIFLAVLIVSNVFLYKKNKPALVNINSNIKTSLA